MTLALLSLLLLGAQQAVPAAPQPDDIVVVAVRHQCRVRLADHDLSSSEFDARARDWAGGRPVRVFAPADADVKCLSRIAFRLADRGVRLMEFVVPPAAVVRPPR